jgi:hypothetical protein
MHFHFIYFPHYAQKVKKTSQQLIFQCCVFLVEELYYRVKNKCSVQSSDMLPNIDKQGFFE